MRKIIFVLITVTLLSVSGMMNAQITKEQRKERHELAKINLAGQMYTDITALIENTVANELTDQIRLLISPSIFLGKSYISKYRSCNSYSRNRHSRKWQ